MCVVSLRLLSAFVFVVNGEKTLTSSYVTDVIETLYGVVQPNCFEGYLMTRAISHLLQTDGSTGVILRPKNYCQPC